MQVQVSVLTFYTFRRGCDESVGPPFLKLVGRDRFCRRRKGSSEIGEIDTILTMSVSPYPALTSTPTGYASLPLTAAEQPLANVSQVMGEARPKCNPEMGHGLVHLTVTSVGFFLRSLGMMGAETASSTPARPQAAFNTTHWSVVLAVSQSDTTRARAALAKLWQTYWYPLYAYVRRRGYSAPDAQDLTQAFFARLLEHHSFASASPELGKFRSYILTAMKHFLASEWKHRRAQKRGGGSWMLSLDWAVAEERFDLEPATQVSPDKLFDKQWAVAVLQDVLNRLEREYHEEGKTDLFAALKQTLLGLREAQP
jgi:DNA-directed RNA polymerase specialized sigma24 family protein